MVKGTNSLVPGLSDLYRTQSLLRMLEAETAYLAVLFDMYFAEQLDLFVRLSLDFLKLR